MCPSSSPIRSRRRDLGLLLWLTLNSLAGADWIHEGLPHLDATTPVHVTTGQQLARAIADAVSGAGPRVIQVDAAQVTLTKADWEGIPLPLVYPAGANLTIRGSPDHTNGPSLLDLTATPAALTLLDNSQLVLEDMIMQYYTNGTLMRGAYFTLLTKSPEGTRNAGVLGRHIASVIPVCLPVVAWQASLTGAPRPGDAPGRQVVSNSTISQEGCSNDTSAPPLQRCWPAVYGVDDIAQAGSDLDGASNPAPTHYNIALQHCRLLCARLLDRDCVESLGPLGCMLVTLRGKDGGTVLRGPPSSPVIAALPTGSPDLAAEGGSSGPPLAAILAGSIVGGVALIALVAAAALVVVTRRRQRDAGLEERKGEELPGQRMHTCSSDGLAGSTSDTLHKDCENASDSKPLKTAPTLRASSSGFTDAGASGTSAAPSQQHARALRASGDRPAPLRKCTASTPTLGPRSPKGSSDVVSSQTPLHTLMIDVKVVDFDTQGKGSKVPTSHDDTDTSVASSACTLRDRVLPAPAALPATDNVVRLTGVVLGKGAYGRVYEGTYQGRLVAVKKLLEGAGNGSSAYTSCAQELEVLGRCDHPNIVKVLAACVVDTARPVMVLERMDTSLDKMLYGSPGTLLPMRVVLHIAIQIAQGLSYLHPTILHRDLKPANVLVSDPQGEAPLVKLSDFGLSRLRESVLVTVQPDAGTPPYTAPECFDLTSASISHRADCYSFGVLLWEMLAGVRPWGGLNALQIAYNVTMSGQRLPVPSVGAPGNDLERWPQRVCTLIRECWEADPRRRPAAAEIVKSLSLAQEELKRGGFLQQSPHCQPVLVPEEGRCLGAPRVVVFEDEGPRAPSLDLVVL